MSDCKSGSCSAPEPKQNPQPDELSIIKSQNENLMSKLREVRTENYKLQVEMEEVKSQLSELSKAVAAEEVPEPVKSKNSKKKVEKNDGNTEEVKEK